MTIVYDPNVFDIAFDVFFDLPVMLKVEVDPLFSKSSSGQIILINIYIVTVNTPGRKFLFNPAITPRITIFNPDGIMRVYNGFMFNIAVGVYQYRHQTGVIFDDFTYDPNVFDIITADPIGPYTGYFTAGDGNMAMKTPIMKLYDII